MVDMLLTPARTGIRELRGGCPIRGLIVDNFAGGGGASHGLRRALGRDPDIAINHDLKAIKMHELNHPNTRHFCESVWDVNPVEVTKGQEVDVAWFSPDCKHFSRAKGGTPVNKNIRGLAWVVIKWAKQVRPKIIFLENVREFQDWGPLIHAKDASGRLMYGEDGEPKMFPDKERKGQTFKRWVTTLRNLGYHVEWKQLNAADYGAPTHRRRLFLIARCDGEAISWPLPTHGPGRDMAYRTAADIIDWSIPCPSIFDRKKPLAEKTMRRIANGIKRFVIDAKDPFIVGLRGPTRSLEPRSVERPLDTVMEGKTKHVVVPSLLQVNHDGEDGRNRSVEKPLPTVTGKNGHAVVVPSLLQVNHGGHDYRNQPVTQPVNTLTAEKSHAVMMAHLTEFYGQSTGRKVDEPAPSAMGCGHTGVVTACMVQSDNTGGNGSYTRDVRAPIGTVVSKNHDMLIAASMVQTGYGERDGQQPRSIDIQKPLGTLVSTGKHALVEATAVPYVVGVGGRQGQTPPVSGDKPLSTITAKNDKAIVAASLLVHMNHGEKQWNDVREPLRTIVSNNHAAEVRAFLVKYYGACNNGQSVNDPLHTTTAKCRFGLVTIKGVDYEIVDIGMRMLSPEELKRAQGFPAYYKLRGSKADQTKAIGNSVPPVMAEVLARANVRQPARKKAVA